MELLSGEFPLAEGDLIAVEVAAPSVDVPTQALWPTYGERFTEEQAKAFIERYGEVVNRFTQAMGQVLADSPEVEPDSIEVTNLLTLERLTRWHRGHSDNGIPVVIGLYVGTDGRRRGEMVTVDLRDGSVILPDPVEFIGNG